LIYVNDLPSKGTRNEHVFSQRLPAGGNTVINKPIDISASFLKFGSERTEAMINMQKELLEAYEQASRTWLARVKSEADLWSELATKLAATRSVPDALGAYQECVTQRMQLAAEDDVACSRSARRSRTRSPRRFPMDGRRQAHERVEPDGR
jgi:hypothetical protein